MLLPREHGAYGQLLFPLLSGALTLAVVMGLAVAAFTGTLAPVAPYAALLTAHLSGDARARLQRPDDTGGCRGADRHRSDDFSLI